MMMIPQPKPRGISINKAPVPLPRRKSSVRKQRCEPIFESSSLTPSEIADMSARAIAAARSRTNADSRPLSAYEETPTMSMNRRRASIAVLPMVNERTMSPEFGAIRVQVEDITTNTEHILIEEEARNSENEEVFEDLGETSTETIIENNKNTTIDSEGYMRREEMSVADWAVPSEYASSPIVVALSESENDERPRPKIPAVYMNTSNSGGNDNENYSDFVSRRNSSISSSTVSNGKSVTLLEQIIRTHAIWYLPHLGRPEVLHLLKRMEPGNFIVRASTRENCMALSMRLPPGDMETDHYIIEKIQLSTAGSSTTNPTNVVRLEGSPRTFRSLPLLIEHYCVNDEELLIRLQLPRAIRNCLTTKQLQSISLMQQDFWTSDMSLSRKPSRSLSRCSMASRDSTDTLRKMEHASTWFMSDNNEIGGRSDDLKNNNETCDGLLIKMPPKKKRSVSRSTTSSNSRFATVCVGDLTHLNGEDETDSCGTGSLAQCYSRQDVEVPSISRIERRSQSVRSHKSVSSTKSTTNTISRPKSFLRSLLSFGSTKESSGIAKKQIDSTPQEYFAPWDQGFGRQVRSSRSAFDITQPPPTRGFLNGSTGRSPRNHVDHFDDENYTKGWKESAEVKSAKASPGGRSVRSESMKTFKPIYDMPSSSTSRTNLRPLTLRHDGTIDTFTPSSTPKNNGLRLAFHNESSPGPARVPMTPPINGNDPQMIQNCVEELRRKRLQSTNEMLTPSDVSFSSQTHSANGTPQISMRRRNNGYPSSPGLSNRPINGYAGINKHNRNSDHRLSVPNLIAATNPLIPKHAERNEDVMTTINEGLVTPLVRRKMFISAQKSAHSENRHSRMIAEVEGVAVGAGEIAKRREVLEAMIDKRKQEKIFPSSSSTTSTSSSSGAESELIWRRTNKQYQNAERRQQKIAKVLPTPQPRVRHIMAAGVISLQPAIDGGNNNDYAQLGELDSARSFLTSKRIETDDDAVSVAGTVFNEPWDSNVWENLLDLAHHGDESELGLKVSEPIQEEDDNAMDSEDDDDDINEEEEEMRWPSSEDLHQRKLPSDRVTVKGWEQQQHDAAAAIKYSTLDSRGSGGGRREDAYSVKSLPRTLSRFSHAALGGSFGSIDDLPTTIPSMSPLLGGGGGSGMRRAASVTKSHGIGKNVQNYVEQLAQVRKGDNACFGLTLRQFIACTKDTKESDPSVVVRNVRQFINGMKNYLVKHGEGDLHRIIDDESSRLTSNQILNIDAVLEAILHKLLLKEVKPLLYHVMVKEHSKSGTLQLISTNIAIVRKMSLKQLGFSNAENLITPSNSTLEQIKLYMRKMQSHYSPLKKLENLMNAVSLILACQTELESDNEQMQTAHMRGLPLADDLVRWLVFILARTSTVGCEVEAWYMWELLPQPILMQSDASYYLTALFSAIHVLKSAEAIRRLCDREEQVTMTNLEVSRTCCSSPLLSTATLTRGQRGGAENNGTNATTTPCDAFVKIAVPDETVGCVRYTTFPGVPLLTTSKLIRLIAHQQGITNPEEHGLYLIADGFESCLQSNDCPVMIHEQLKKENKPHLFAYKRHEAKIAWPRTAISTY